MGGKGLGAEERGGWIVTYRARIRVVILVMVKDALVIVKSVGVKIGDVGIVGRRDGGCEESGKGERSNPGMETGPVLVSVAFLATVVWRGGGGGRMGEHDKGDGTSDVSVGTVEVVADTGGSTTATLHRLVETHGVPVDVVGVVGRSVGEEGEREKVSAEDVGVAGGNDVGAHKADAAEEDGDNDGQGNDRCRELLGRRILDLDRRTGQDEPGGVGVLLIDWSSPRDPIGGPFCKGDKGGNSLVGIKLVGNGCGGGCGVVCGAETEV